MEEFVLIRKQKLLIVPLSFFMISFAIISYSYWRSSPFTWLSKNTYDMLSSGTLTCWFRILFLISSLEVRFHNGEKKEAREIPLNKATQIILTSTLQNVSMIFAYFESLWWQYKNIYIIPQCLLDHYLFVWLN